MTSVPPNKMLFQQFFWRYNVYIRELIVRSGETRVYSNPQNGGKVES
jgi:hypothetical protein